MMNAVQSRERLIRTNGVELATETFGDAADAPLLLIMGGMASMLWWPDEFCRTLASRGRYLIRYDHRDTGRSTKYPPGSAPYSLDDFVKDAIGVLDEYGITRAHIVGMSLGGMIGQLTAVAYPARVLSLTAISTTPVLADSSRLPASEEAWFEHQATTSGTVDWSDRAQVIGFLVDDARLTASTAHAFDEAQFRAFVGRDYDRSGGYLSATNHGALMQEPSKRIRSQDIRAPLLVIHGTSDPVFPIGHGIALSTAVPGAKLVRIEGGGHELHPADWGTIIDAVVAHTNVGQTNGTRGD
jgi:pimeloyl-ACP methyl ester carboxylesterase